MKTFFLILLALHAVIHLAGFTVAFRPAALPGLHSSISRGKGTLWLLAFAMLCASAVLLLMSLPLWWLIAGCAALLSQVLIFFSWRAAKYGTTINTIILAAAVAGGAAWYFHSRFTREAAMNIARSSSPPVLLTEADIRQLPALVQKYIRYSGALNKPRVNSFRVEFTGRIRDYEKQEWMDFTSVQYNFQQPATRLFFMNATMKHLPVAGYHCFRNGSAFMDIRLLSLFTVQYQSGAEMNRAETVTFFNDMCVMAPATLIDGRITWTPVDSLRADAAFTNNGITIHASLFFSESGALINFISSDRYALTGGKLIPLQWSTPLGVYRSYNGALLGSAAQTIYAYPDGDFCYGEFGLTAVEYNPQSIAE